MKKLDLHIHTIQSVSDPAFEFSIDKLKSYVAEMSIDGIAITNHNIFKKEQYIEIKKELNDLCVVLPGIEIDLGIKSRGHIICISSDNTLDDFVTNCNRISEKIIKKNDYITYDEFRTIFSDLSKYLWIPHYDKSPELEQEIINDMKEYIFCGEVGSVKKFLYNQKITNRLTPVYFSDSRPTKDLVAFSTRQTYFDIDEITVSSIKKSLLDRNHVSLTEDEGNKQFFILPDLKISTGLNVMIGERSSGKTHTLDNIFQSNTNVKYIKQFSLIENEPEKCAKKFTDTIAQKRKSFSEEYLEQFKDAVNTVKDISISEDEIEIDQYISSLKKYATETDRMDSFAKCALYSEDLFPERSFEGIKTLITAIETLLSAREYRKIIDKHIEYSALISLLKELITVYRRDNFLSLKEKWVNDLVESIKLSLKKRSATTEITKVDLYKCQMNRIKVEKFNKLAALVMHEEVINTQEIEGYIIQTKKHRFNNAQDLRDFSNKRNVRFSDTMSSYNKNPYEYLLKLKAMDEIPDTDYYKYFACIDYKVLNKYGFPVSGGERAEFNLLQEINDAYKYDIMLIDEPESSFDNIFLKTKVNHIIKELSETMPVIIVTHNNTVGASINPDYIIHTKRIPNKEKVVYERYCGLPSSKTLKSNSGQEIPNINVIMDCLEAGQESYDERKKNYDLLKN